MATTATSSELLTATAAAARLRVSDSTIGKLSTLWVAGLDPAFSSDPFGLALVGRDPANLHRLGLGLARAWLPQRSASFEERRAVEDTVLAEVAAVCHAYGASVVTDEFAAPAVVDFLSRRGLNVRTEQMTATSKTQAFVELRARLNTGTLGLYDEPTLLAELRRLRTRYFAGASAVVNPRVGGSHGDMAQALALAVLEHARMTSDPRTARPSAGCRASRPRTPAPQRLATTTCFEAPWGVTGRPQSERKERRPQVADANRCHAFPFAAAESRLTDIPFMGIREPEERSICVDLVGRSFIGHAFHDVCVAPKRNCVSVPERAATLAAVAAQPDRVAARSAG